MPNVTVLRCGIAKNKSLGFSAMFQRVTVKLSTKFRLWPIRGDSRFLELDPSEFRAKYTVVKEYATSASGRPT